MVVDAQNLDRVFARHRKDGRVKIKNLFEQFDKSPVSYYEWIGISLFV